MSEALQAFHFLQPWWLLALLGLPLLWWLTRRDAAMAALSRLVDASLLPHVLDGDARRRSPFAWLALGWVLATLAMAGPTWSRVAQPLYAQRAAQVVALSLSQHMLARDVVPDRIGRARYKVRDLLNANHDGLNALVAYAGDAFVVAPLTSDANSLDDLLDALAPDTMPVDGDNAAQAITRGVALIINANVGGGSLVLVTDDADADAIAAASKARSEGVRVSVLGVGTPQGATVPLADGSLARDAQGSPLLAHRDDTALRALADAGGGRYVGMRDDHADIDALAGQRQVAHSANRSIDQHGDEWQDRGPWLLLPLLPLLALAFRRGWLLMLPLLWLPLASAPAHADGWRDWFLRPDQQAAHALAQGQAKQAQALAHDPSLRGAAAYRAGDYASAAASLRDVPAADAQYNLGNALARERDYQGALAAYDRALKTDPSHADAQANRKAVQDWLQRQPPKQDQDPKQGGARNDKQSSGQSPPAPNQQQTAQDHHPPADKNGPSQDQQKSPDSTPKKGDQQASPDNAASTPQEQAEQQARAAQAQQALQKQMDQALGKPQPAQPPASHELGAAAPDDPQSKLPADVRQALQRVPDDPGALLRRKFELEYQRRHGDMPSNEDQP